MTAVNINLTMVNKYETESHGQTRTKRTLKTRARLVAAASEVIEDVGFEALRVEQVVKKAGVAKGTFFAHFRDKDALMDRLIGARLDAHLDRIDALPTPDNVDALVAAMLPMASHALPTMNAPEATAIPMRKWPVAVVVVASKRSVSAAVAKPVTIPSPSAMTTQTVAPELASPLEDQAAPWGAARDRVHS